jgi:hypothetical protein
MVDYHVEAYGAHHLKRPSKFQSYMRRIIRPFSICGLDHLVDDLEEEERVMNLVQLNSEFAPMKGGTKDILTAYDNSIYPEVDHINPDLFEDDDDEIDDSVELFEPGGAGLFTRQQNVDRQLTVSSRFVSEVLVAVRSKIGSHNNDSIENRCLVEKVARKVMRDIGTRNKVADIHIPAVIDAYFSCKAGDEIFGARRGRTSGWLLRFLGFKVDATTRQ